MKCDKCGEEFDPNLTSTSLNNMHATCQGDAAWEMSGPLQHEYYRDISGSVDVLRGIIARHVRAYTATLTSAARAVVDAWRSKVPRGETLEQRLHALAAALTEACSSSERSSSGSPKGGNGE